MFCFLLSGKQTYIDVIFKTSAYPFKHFRKELALQQEFKVWHAAHAAAFMITSIRSFKHGTFFFFWRGGGGGGAPILYGNYEFVWIMYAKIGVGGSTSDKSGVPEVDSCAAQMSLNNIQGHSYNLHVSDQII